MMPPANPQQFTELLLAGCEWDEDGPGGPANPPGPVDFPDDQNGNGPEKPGPGDNSNPPGGGPNGGLGGRSARVPEATMWLLLGLGMTVLIFVRHKAALAPARR